MSKPGDPEQPRQSLRAIAEQAVRSAREAAADTPPAKLEPKLALGFAPASSPPPAPVARPSPAVAKPAEVAAPAPRANTESATRQRLLLGVSLACAGAALVALLVSWLSAPTPSATAVSPVSVADPTPIAIAAPPPSTPTPIATGLAAPVSPASLPAAQPEVAREPEATPAVPRTIPRAAAAPAKQPTAPTGPSPQAAPAADPAAVASQPAASESQSGSVPLTPAVGAVQTAIGSVLGYARNCIAGEREASRARVTFAANGQVSQVAVSGPAAGTPAEACVKAALSKARVAPFQKPSYSVDTTVRP